MASVLYRANNLKALKNAIFDALKTHRGERNIVIVPDQYSFATEREVLKALGTACAFDVEVASFSRLADKVVGRAQNMLNKQTCIILMHRVIIEVADKLECYGKAAKMRGFAREMYAVVTNIRNSGVKPDELKRIVPKLTGGVRAKTKDIATIYAAYMEYLNKYCDMTGMLERLYERMLNDDETVNANFFITDFYDMADIKLKLVDLLLSRANNVYIGALKYDGRNRALSVATDKIAHIAEAHKAKTVQLPKTLDEDKSIVADNLFSYGINTIKNGTEKYRLMTFPSFMHEIEYVAEDIKRKVTREGKRFKDFAIVLPEIAFSSNRVKRVLTRYGIPYYIDERYEIINHTLYRVLVEGLVARSLNRQDVLNFIKERVFSVSDSDKEKFENYCLSANIDGKNFNKPFPDDIEPIRAKAISLINLLNKSVQNVDEYARLINEFYKLLAYNIDSDLSDIGDIDAQIPEKIAECVESVKGIFEGITATRAEYDDALLIALESVKISTVPLYIDSVFVGDSSETRFDDIDTIYMIGANDGAYPTTTGDSGIVRDAECEAWSKHGVIIQAAADRERLSKLNIVNTLLKPNNTVISSVNSKPDSLLKIQLKKLFNLPVLTNRFSYSDSAERIAEHMASEQNYKRELNSGRVTIRGEETQEKRADTYAVADDAFYKGGVSPSSIESFYNCPYRYFVEKVLRIKRRDEAEETVQLLGTFMHDVLERYYTRYELRENEIERLTADICNEVLADDGYSTLVRSGDFNTVKKMLTARAIYAVKALDDEFGKSEFKPIFCEYNFGYDGTDEGLEFETDGKTYRIAGKVDRVDEAIIEVDGKPKRCIAVIDYKSSEKETNDIKLAEGLILQLPIYTAITARNLGAEPVAMLYAAMPTKYVKGGSVATCTGYVVDRSEYLYALDPHYCDYANTHLPFRTSSANPKKFKGLISEARLKEISNNAITLMQNAVKIINSEPLLPTGVEACEYCEYSRICNKDEFEKGRADLISACVNGNF